MRSLLRALMVCVLLAAGAASAKAPDASALKRQATKAYRAKRYAEACPLFQAVVRELPADAWSWNDLALCRIRSGEFEQVVEPLTMAIKLAATVNDAKLLAAAQTNANLLAQRLLAFEQLNNAQATAAMDLASLPVVNVDEEHENSSISKQGMKIPSCALYKKVRASDHGLTSEGWLHLARCLADEGASDAAARAALRSYREAGGEYVRSPRGGEPFSYPATASASEGDWKSRCRPMGSEDPTCGRTLLVCAEGDAFVVIEAASLSKWTRSPFEIATGAQVISTSSSHEFTSCPVPPEVQAATGFSSANGESSEHDAALGFDACLQTYVRWKVSFHCSEVTGPTLTEEPFSVVALPSKKSQPTPVPSKSLRKKTPPSKPMK
jgi:hypothetical protein